MAENKWRLIRQRIVTGVIVLLGMAFIVFGGGYRFVRGLFTFLFEWFDWGGNRLWLIVLGVVLILWRVDVLRRGRIRCPSCLKTLSPDAVRIVNDDGLEVKVCRFCGHTFGKDARQD